MRDRTSWKPLLTFRDRPVESTGILMRREFHQLLNYERDRADRTGSRFTLIMIKLDQESCSPSALRRYIANIVLHTRDTDHIGWHGKNQLGILLTDTTISGAQAFLKYIHGYTSDFGITSAVEFIMYPRVTNMRLFVDGENVDEEDRCYSTYVDNIAPVLRKSVPRWKRRLDIAGSIAGLLFFSPIFLLIPLYIALVSPGPVIFRQKRVGLGGIPFDFLKFRTMKAGNDTVSHNRHLKQLIKSGKSMTKLDGGDSRIIRGGKLIRSLGLDELPQLWNILRGEMSLVGPRPCIPYEADIYLHWHRKRFDILPGLTGLWQVSGKNRLSFQEMIRLDIQYSETMSPGRDVVIIFRTIPSMAIGMIRSILGNWAGRKDEKKKEPEDSPDS